MAKNVKSGGRDRSASRSRSHKKRKERSRSAKAAVKDGKKSKGKESRSPSRKKKGRSPSAKKRQSPSRKRGRSRKRSASAGTKGKETMQQKAQAAMKALMERQQKQPSPRRKPGQRGPVVVKPPAEPSVSPERQRASPSYDRGASSSIDRRPERKGSDRSRSGSPKEAAGKQLEVISVTLNDRPFGMGPSKEAGVCGYVVSKVADDKPAGEAGVKPGWHLVSIAGEPCRSLDLEAIQVLIKGCALPVAVEFEREKEDAPAAKADSDGSEEELDIIDVRAASRMANQSGIDLLDELPVKRSPEDLPPPIGTWQDAVDRKFLNKALADKLAAAGLKRPTLIQRHALPIVSHEQGHYDMIASAQTGSGKTFAFVIPTVGRLIVEGAAGRPFFAGAMAQAQPLVLVLSPTRELAMQTEKEIGVLTQGTSLKSMCIYGGESLKFQMQKLVKEQTDVICGTPGRLIDLIDASKVSLSFIQSVVLDEADQMLEQSLEIMCDTILTGRDMPQPSERQTLLFSATMPKKIKDMVPRLLRESLGRVAHLTIGHYNEENKGGSCSSIKQILRWVPEEHMRAMAMVQDLNRLWVNAPGGKKGRVVIFTNQRLQAGQLSHALQNNGISNLHLHGKLPQHEREEVFDAFRRGAADVLVATNVASRGLDFADISFVVQYNLPSTIDPYTHRIGRTGRVGQVGCALAYVGPKDRHIFPKLVDFLELNKQEVPSFLQPAREPERGRGGGGAGWNARSRSRGRRPDNRRQQYLR